MIFGDGDQPRPYLGLRRYHFEDHHLFAGRSRDVERFAARLQNGPEKILLIHGTSGCGKSSFLEAGLFPRLIDDFEHQKSDLSPLPLRGPRSGKALPSLTRLGSIPFTQIAYAIYRLKKGSEQNGVGPSWHRFLLRARLDDEFLIEQLGDLPMHTSPTPRFLIVVDQSEDIFERSVDPSVVCERDRFFRFLAQLTVMPAFAKIVVSLRTDYKARFDDELLLHKAAFSRIASYYLDDLTGSAIVEAIVHPTTLPEFEFEFHPDVPRLICTDLGQLTPSQPVLPVLQVICDRLYDHLKAGNRRTITESEYRATGAANLQTGVYLEEKLITFILADDPKAIDLADRADRWKQVLLHLVDETDSARPRAKTPVSEKELLGWANAEKCSSALKMFDWLALPGQCVLEKNASDPALKPQGGWRLVHDSLALALVSWSRTNIIRSDTERVAGGLVGKQSAEIQEYRSKDLFARPPKKCRLLTINDLIWDHLMHLFAQQRGFAERLGLSFSIHPDGDLTQTDRELDYTKFLAEDATPEYSRFVILPSSIFPAIKTAPWLTVTIGNLYRGFAIIGRSRPDVLPLIRSTGSNDHKLHGLNIERLEQLAKVLCRKQTKIHAYEKESAALVDFIAKKYKRRRRNTIEIFTASRSKFNSAKDPMFTSLVDNKVDFALGPAPSRALALQAGFTVFADFDSVYSVATTQQERAELDKLLIHENCAVEKAGLTEETTMRLVSVLFFTVEFIRQYPEEFVKFCYGQMHRAVKDGAYPIQREYIRSAVLDSYEFVSAREYPFAYLDREGRAYYEGKGDGPGTIYEKWIQYRRECDALFLKLLRHDAWRASRVGRAAFRRAQMHYRILNFYDAHEELARIEGMMKAQ